jgi:nucleotide sugar dehydrogenase
VRSLSKVGIVGHGYVGSALKHCIPDSLVYDIDEEKSEVKSLADLIECEIIFICVPTPSNPDGSCDTSIVSKVIHSITYDVDKAKSNLINPPNPIIIIKSTIPPGTTDLLQKTTGLSLVFSPEFLTEANHLKDMKNATRIILGGNTTDTLKISPLITPYFPKATIAHTQARMAEIVKYATNAFLATKVAFANEMFGLISHLDLDYKHFKDLFLFDRRINQSHLQVPGTDGKFGFGGSCLPKDLKGLLHTLQDLKLNHEVIAGVLKSNEVVRE